MRKINFQPIIIVLILIIIGLIILILNLEKKSDSKNESLFDKQEQCANNRENAQKQLEENFKTMTPYFYDIFYSPKTNTCIYTYGLVISGVSPNEIGSFVIADYFTGEELYSVNYDNSSGNESEYSYTVRPQFSEKIESYKK